jgi:ATP-dependent helicase/nuclease subunit A
VLGDALLLPDDDLALATVLKSPLFGLDDDQLFALAYKRKGSLRSALRQKASEDRAFDVANRDLGELERLARELTPFAFYAHVLGPRQGRKRILARLGIEADDPLDEFLNLALDHERQETPSLQGFLHWIRVGQTEVKRDMEMGRDEVRVMTVHGAKGLEARNVILIDATTVRPEGAYPPRLLEAPVSNMASGVKALIWCARKDLDVGPMGAARTATVEAAKDEYRRLLYVGMTRAADRLVVCATKGVNKVPEGCWYDLVCTALVPEATEETDAEGGKVWRRRQGDAETKGQSERSEAKRIELPAWLEQASAPQPKRRIILPSRTDDDEPRHRFASAGDRDKALRRGTLIHRLLQSLPDVPLERRDTAAKVFLAKQGDLSDAERAEMAAETLRILGDARFAPLFAPGSRAEISIAGEVRFKDETEIVAGQVDRLAVTDAEVLLADYKTNRSPPARIEDAPPAYVRQLALYRAVLKKIYPTKTICAALIWTETPDLMELSPEALDNALLQFTSA